MAEAVGFEPTVPLRVRQFSRLVPSTTRPHFLTNTAAVPVSLSRGLVSVLRSDRCLWERAAERKSPPAEQR